MTFGEALECLKSGKRVARSGWNGPGMWVVLIEPGNAMHRSSVGSFDMQPCFGLKTTRNTMQPGWIPSISDILSCDWIVME